MGGGPSIHIEKQEAFVKKNLESFKTTLNASRVNSRYFQPYSNGQVEGKLRQLYHSSDVCSENRRSYIDPYEWDKAKKNLRY
jgi:hypothetical protein